MANFASRLNCVDLTMRRSLIKIRDHVLHGCERAADAARSVSLPRFDGR
ncbi:MAG: hypothetical protein LBS27_10180 [Bifidobacteriaceae bacterium]|jgi:hypothetical protein|nr:hypothetical protein [Bifidobacteriaceae bacterium]